MRRLIPLALLVLAVAVAAIADAAPSEPEAVGTAVAVRVTQLGLQDQVGLSVYAPPTADDSISGWSYPEDGSVARIGSATGSAAAQPGVSSSAQAIVELLAVTLFGGEITVESVRSRATAAAGAVNASSDASASTVTGLTVLGQLITPSANTQVPLADWGLLDILASTVESTLEPPRAARATVTGLRVKLLLDHGGLPAGSVIEIGAASATAAAAGAEEPTAVVPAPKPVKPAVARPVVPASAPREPGGTIIPGRSGGARPPGTRRVRAPQRGRLRVPRLRSGLVR